MARKILVTGAAGRIGTIVREHLGGKYDLAGLDRIAVEGVDSHVADLSDLDAIRPAFEGQEIVVHLGADPNGSAPWDSVLPNNIVGVYNVLEDSRERASAAWYSPAPTTSWVSTLRRTSPTGRSSRAGSTIFLSRSRS